MSKDLHWVINYGWLKHDLRPTRDYDCEFGPTQIDISWLVT
ncbi:MAG TPA: hypothetical protein PK329_06945 [Myxococcota bacterium]|jgi:hypothetical protein|nr:hypothetical protein [Myxococcota bacterium]HON24349.1 hypothetical protein [Myxococcota bacterium]HOS62073.1 hypothetical protein [Myxococcota bacterium]HPC91797.1 hypothetical protein [Myxococcota bacterium]HPL25175.1 hypothetical protein [Myxococcota bacterium]